MKSFAFVSDVHAKPLCTPAADVLICAGDMTNHGQEEEQFIRLNSWFAEQPQEQKFFLPGNHDVLAYKDLQRAQELITNATIVVDRLVTIHGAKCYFSPWIRSNDPKWAYPLMDGTYSARDKWKEIPEGLDLLITHGPPYGISDLSHREKYHHLGDGFLKNRLESMADKPKVHVFGHVHEGQRFTEKWGISFFNVSICDVKGQAVKTPLVLGFQEGVWTVQQP